MLRPYFNMPRPYFSMPRPYLRTGCRDVRVRMNSLERSMKPLSFCFILLFAVSSVSSAQTFYGIAGGLNYAGALPDANPLPNEHYTRGFAVQGSVGRQFSDRFGVRLDAFVNHFAVQATEIRAFACPMGALCDGSQPNTLTNPVGVTALRANALLTLDPPAYAVRMYLIGGFGGYYFYQHPTIEGAVRPGVSGGVGFNVSVNGRSRVFVEGLYNKILSAPSQPTWLLPLTVGVRF
jgi:hypothetical protein